MGLFMEKVDDLTKSDFVVNMKERLTKPLRPLLDVAIELTSARATIELLMSTDEYLVHCVRCSCRGRVLESVDVGEGFVKFLCLAEKCRALDYSK
jgi:hypothetical protein